MLLLCDHLLGPSVLQPAVAADRCLSPCGFAALACTWLCCALCSHQQATWGRSTPLERRREKLSITLRDQSAGWTARDMPPRSFSNSPEVSHRAHLPNADAGSVRVDAAGPVAPALSPNAPCRPAQTRRHVLQIRDGRPREARVDAGGRGPRVAQGHGGRPDGTTIRTVCPVCERAPPTAARICSGAGDIGPRGVEVQGVAMLRQAEVLPSLTEYNPAPRYPTQQAPLPSPRSARSAGPHRSAITAPSPR